MTGGGLQEPQYPRNAHAVAPGQCLQGWITFVVTPTSRIVTATYQPDLSGQPQTGGRWRVG